MPGAVHASGAKSSEARTSKPWVCSEVRTDVWVPLGKSLYLSRLWLLYCLSCLAETFPAL